MIHRRDSYGFQQEDELDEQARGRLPQQLRQDGTAPAMEEAPPQPQRGQHARLTRDFRQLLAKIRQQEGAGAARVAAPAALTIPSSDPSRVAALLSSLSLSLDSPALHSPQPRAEPPPMTQPVPAAAAATTGGGSTHTHHAPPKAAHTRTSSTSSTTSTKRGAAAPVDTGGERYLAHLQSRLAAAEGQATEERGRRLALEAQLGVTAKDARAAVRRVQALEEMLKEAGAGEQRAAAEKEALMGRMRALRAVNTKLQKESDALRARVQALEDRKRHEAQAEAHQERATVVGMKQFVQQKVAAAERQATKHKRTIQALQVQLTAVAHERDQLLRVLAMMGCMQPPQQEPQQQQHLPGRRPLSSTSCSSSASASSSSSSMLGAGEQEEEKQEADTPYRYPLRTSVELGESGSAPPESPDQKMDASGDRNGSGAKAAAVQGPWVRGAGAKTY